MTTFDIQWPLVIFSLFAGTGGTLACSVGVAQLMGRAKQARFVGAIVALALLVVGGLASVAHLTLPLHAFYAVTNLGSFSGISVELMLLAIAFVVVLVYAILLKRAEKSEGALKTFAVLSIVAGLALAFFCGHGYVIEARAGWDTNLLPFAYLGSVLPAGVMLYLALAAKLGADAEELRSFNAYAIVAVAVSIVACAAYLVFLGADMMARNVAASWVAVVVFGIVGEIAVLVALLRAKAANAVFALAVAGVVLALICGIGIRVEMWVASDAFFDAFYWEIGNGVPIGLDS